MKKILLGIVLVGSTTSFAQNNTYWYDATPNTSSAGYIGIGTNTGTLPTNTPLPNFNLHVHGVADYISSGNVSSMGTGGSGGPVGTMKSSINYGVTSRIGLTNTSTGRSDMEGTVLQMSQLNFYLKNQSQGDLSLSIPNLSFTLSHSSGRAWLGSNLASTSPAYGKFNVVSSDNGLYIQSNNTTKYGLRVKVPIDNSIAMEVFGNNSSNRNFAVTGGGEVYARKYTTTLNPIPDYVFSLGYDLMPITDLREYVQTNHHLPNIPSAEELSSEPVDIGEMNRLLLEKVEELTLYVLELEDRLRNLEEDEK